MKIKSKVHNRIEDINESIEKLLNERKKLVEEMTHSFTEWLIEKNALKHDQEALKGAILSVLSVLENVDDESQKQKELWKKEAQKDTKEKKSSKKA